MSGVEILGLISGTITLIDAILKLREKYIQANDVPRAFCEVLDRLPLMEQTLEKAKRNTAYIGPRAAKDIQQVVGDCSAKAKKLRDIYESVVPTEGDFLGQTYRRIYRRMGEGSKVEELAQSMLRDLCTLANNWSLGAATSAEIKQLEIAIEELDRVDPSIIDEDYPTNMSNGSGGIANNYGDGKLYTVSGSGNVQYNGDTQNFGKDR